MPTDSKIDNTHLYAAMRLTPNGYWEGRSGATDLKATATCFLIGDGRAPRNPGFLVTNKHVLAPPADEKRGLCRIESITIDGFSQKPYTFGERGAVEAFSFTVRCPSAILPEDVGLDSKLDVACIDLSTADIEGDAPTPDLWGTMLGTELDYHKLTAGSDVVISGYPSVLTDDGDLEAGERPILVSGIIASDPRYPATFGARKLEEAVLTHSFSWGGMSGSPVFALVRDPHGGRLMNPRPGARPSPEHHIILAGVNAGHFRLQQESSAAGSITHFMKAPIIAQMIGYTTGHAMVGPVAMPEPE